MGLPSRKQIYSATNTFELLLTWTAVNFEVCSETLALYAIKLVARIFLYGSAVGLKNRDVNELQCSKLASTMLTL